METSNDEYLNKNVKQIVEPLILAILREKPAEPVTYIF